jgi:hypothetical protein
MKNPPALNTPWTLQICNREPYEGTFEGTIIEAVDESFSTLGQSCKQAIYFHLENTFDITKHEIPSKIEPFTEAIEEIFGDAAKLVEMRIIEALHRRNQDHVFYPGKREVVFTEYVASLRCFLARQP